ncbi:MAG: SGNH family hydrolase [Rhizobiaceae bacterium]
MKLVTRLVVLLGLLVAFQPVLPVGLGADIAMAQQNQQAKKRPNLFDLLFGGALRRQQRPEKEKARRIIVNPAGGSVTAAQAPRKQAVEKVETALNILVVGDFMAGGLASGLAQSYTDNANVVIVDKSSGLSGLVRDDVVDWPAKIPELIEEFKPAAVVFLGGMNDRQQMRLETGRAKKLTDEWKKEYELRADRIAKAVRDRSLPLIWVGLPPVNSTAMISDYLVFNEVYRNKAEAAGAIFVDVWDGFTNAEGKFVNAGPDINGQIVRLRNSDGINMTGAGKAKLAFYAEKELRRIPGLDNSVQTALLPGTDLPIVPLEPEYNPAVTGRTIVIQLDSPQADGTGTLEGEGKFIGQDGEGEKSTSHALVTSGLAPSPKAGRIDFAWGAAGVEVARPKDGKKIEEPTANAAGQPATAN